MNEGIDMNNLFYAVARIGPKDVPFVVVAESESEARKEILVVWPEADIMAVDCKKKNYDLCMKLKNHDGKFSMVIHQVHKAFSKPALDVAYEWGLDYNDVMKKYSGKEIIYFSKDDAIKVFETQFDAFDAILASPGRALYSPAMRKKFGKLNLRDF